MRARWTSYDWLLFLHVLGAFVAVGAMTALWGLILGTRSAATALIDQRSTAMTYGRSASASSSVSG